MDPHPLRSPVWLGIALVLVLIELAWRLHSRRGYDRGTAMTTLGLVAGHIPVAILTSLTLAGIYGFVWKIAPVHWPLDDWRTWALGFVVVEFAYYWFHRFSHRVRWMWATHSVHHSAEQMTLLSSLRLGWTNLLSAGWVVYLPLVYAGFDPRLVIGLLAFDLHYQFLLHTEARISLGPLEWVLNTPSHHRVHHGANPAYIDRNYGGVVIVFDRLFGTFAGERADEPVRYGLAHRPLEPNPVRLSLREWRAIAHDVVRARSFKGLMRALLAPPEAAIS